jgi:carboxylesterase type B
VAYRLAALGFLAHPGLVDAEGRAGNYALLDQQAALRWVRRNIRAFGGDPANVTLWGEGGGGISVLAHLASPLAKGLFDKAIVQDGVYGLERQMPLSMLSAYGEAIVNSALPYPGSVCRWADSACLRGLPIATVRDRVNAHFTAYMPEPVPSVDGHVLTKTIAATFQAGENHKLPLLVANAAAGDGSLACGALQLARRVHQQRTPVWMAELREPGRDALAPYWTNFARTGDPNRGASVPAPWPRFAGQGSGDIASVNAAGLQPLAAPFDAAHQCGTKWPAIAL